MTSKFAQVMGDVAEIFVEFAPVANVTVVPLAWIKGQTEFGYQLTPASKYAPTPAWSM